MQETQETQVQSLGRKDPLEKEMATHSSIFAWEIPWTDIVRGSQRVGCALATKQPPCTRHCSENSYIFSVQETVALIFN